MTGNLGLCLLRGVGQPLSSWGHSCPDASADSGHGGRNAASNPPRTELSSKPKSCVGGGRLAFSLGKWEKKKDVKGTLPRVSSVNQWASRQIVRSESKGNRLLSEILWVKGGRTCRGRGGWRMERWGSPVRGAVHRCCVVNPGKQSRAARSRDRAACHPAVYHGAKGPKLRRPFFLTITAHRRSLHTGGPGPVRSQWCLLWSPASRLSISQHPTLTFHLRRARGPVLSNTCLPTRQALSHSSKRGTQKLCPWSRHLTGSSPYHQNQCNYGICLMPTLPISWMILFVQFGSDLTYTPRDNLTETWLQRRSLVKEEES